MLASRTRTDPSVAASPRMILSASESRVMIKFFAPATGALSLNNEPGLAFGTGIVLFAGQTNVSLWLEYDGDCVQREWYVTYTGVFAPLCWIEALATCEPDQMKYLGRKLRLGTRLY